MSSEPVAEPVAAPVEAAATPAVEAPVTPTAEEPSAAATAVAKGEQAVKDAEAAVEKEATKAVKATRRLSARFTGFFKHKDASPKKETPSSTSSSDAEPAATTAAVAAEPAAEAAPAEAPAAAVTEAAPKIEEPAPTEPIQMEAVSSLLCGKAIVRIADVAQPKSSAPPTAPAVAAAA